MTAARRRVRGVGPTLAGVVAVLLVWELLARTVLAGTYVIAAPSEIARAVIEHRGLYRRAALTTAGEAARGFLWGNVAAIGLAALVAIAPFTERVVLYVALVVFCLPLVAMGPLLRVVGGAGDLPQVALAALAVFYTTLVPLVVGLRAVPRTWSDLVASYGRGRLTALMTVRMRASVPYLMTGLQVAAPASLLGALVGEFTGAERGLGLLTINAMRGLRTAELWAVATVAAAVAVTAYVAVGALARRLNAHQPAVLLTPPPGPAGRTRRRRLRTGVELAITLVVLWALWVGSMRLLDLDPYFAKRPGDVWNHLVSAPQAGAHRRELLDAFVATARVAGPGYALGLLAGATGAAAFELSTTLRRSLTPFAVALRCVPIVALAPLLVQAFGRGVAGTTATVAVMTFFPTLVACSYGLRQTPQAVLDLYASYDAGRLRTLWSGQLPAMLPAFFAAARIAVPATVLAATVAEWLATGTGLGHLMALAAIDSRYSTLWSCVVIVSGAAALGYAAVTVVERAVLARTAPEQLTWA